MWSTTRPSARNTHRVGVTGGDRVVGDHGDGLAELVDGACAGTPRISCARPRVEVAGRLVGEHDVGPGGERPGDGDALLLAAGQLGSGGGRGGPQADGGDHRRRATPRPAGGRRAGTAGTMFSRGGHRRQQVERLEHEADAVAAQRGELLVGHRRRGRRRRCAPGPPVSVSSPAMQCSSVDLPGPGRPHDRREAAGGELDGHVVEGAHAGVTGAVHLRRRRAPPRRRARSHGWDVVMVIVIDLHRAGSIRS